MSHYRFATRALLSIAMLGALVGCNQSPSEHHWKQVTELTGTKLEFYFVVVDAPFAHDRRTYQDAGDNLCKTDICQIGFFAARNDVPSETMTADFFNNGGWQDRHETALFSRNTNSGLNILQFDCNYFPQPDLNSCLTNSSPSADAVKAAKARGPLNGFGRVRFGMTLEQVVAALGGRSRAFVMNSDEARKIARTKTVYHGRTYNAFYNVTAPGFSTVLLRWSASIDNDACVAEAKKIAADVAKDFGKEDEFSYFETGGKTFRYKWSFADGGVVEINNLDMKDDDCTLVLDFESKGDAG